MAIGMTGTRRDESRHCVTSTGTETNVVGLPWGCKRNTEMNMHFLYFFLFFLCSLSLHLLRIKGIYCNAAIAVPPVEQGRVQWGEEGHGGLGTPQWLHDSPQLTIL